MGTFLASNLKIKDGVIHICGASSNVRPLYFEWTTYDSYESLFYDLVSGCTEFRYFNIASDKVNVILHKIEAEHLAKYPEAAKSRFNPFCLYDMLKTHNKDRDDFIKKSYGRLSSYELRYQGEQKTEIDLYAERWQEFSDHVDYLFNKFKINMENSFDKKQMELVLL